MGVEAPKTYVGKALVRGRAAGQVEFSDTALSFWGGVDSFSSEVIDRHHPLSGRNLSGKILAIPGGRGSCTGSSVIMELIVNGNAPAGIVVSRQEEILSLGVIVAEEVFGRSIPVVQLSKRDFEALADCSQASIDGDLVLVGASSGSSAAPARLERPHVGSLRLTERDRAILDGKMGKAAQVAMKVTARMADIQDAEELIDVSQVHVDGCIYTGPTSLEFAKRMLGWGAAVIVPTSLNSISVDQMRWREQGVAAELAGPASELGEAYASMGAKKTFTCAPYQLDTAPKLGDQVVWAESNAVVYANSVLGARTTKYPDYLDLCIALTGRAPLTGAHVAENRKATIVVEVSGFAAHDDMVYPLLGYHVGKLVGDAIPVLRGLESWQPNLDDLKAFGAGFATTSGSPMFHIVGVTPEAQSLEDVLAGTVLSRHDVRPADLAAEWASLNAEAEIIGLVALGNPHFSFDEIGKLASLCRGTKKHPDVHVLVTCNRDTFLRASEAGLIRELREFGVQFITDTCWCMLGEPVIPQTAETIITNSAKFAHYGPGLTGRKLRIGTLADCVDAARGQVIGRVPPAWGPSPSQ
ncbi:aconitase X [Rhizobium leguminosarum]|uniref:cis-3-hydroxy-L-proline dehydratase n=1 Tax=Rhizobium leguminosarum TaxID=384 RepID=UPI003D059008